MRACELIDLAWADQMARLFCPEGQDANAWRAEFIATAEVAGSMCASTDPCAPVRWRYSGRLFCAPRAAFRFRKK